MISKIDETNLVSIAVKLVSDVTLVVRRLRTSARSFRPNPEQCGEAGQGRDTRKTENARRRSQLRWCCVLRLS
jgi:hypothetical protein